MHADLEQLEELREARVLVGGDAAGCARRLIKRIYFILPAKRAWQTASATASEKERVEKSHKKITIGQMDNKNEATWAMYVPGGGGGGGGAALSPEPMIAC